MSQKLILAEVLDTHIYEPSVLKTALVPVTQLIVRIDGRSTQTIRSLNMFMLDN